MRLERTAAGFRLAEDEEVYLDLSLAQYEDIFYALPQEPANLYMLLNGTILTEADDCAILHFLIEANGGVEPAMAKLQEMVQALPPKEGDVPAVAESSAPAPAEPAPVEAAPPPVEAQPAPPAAREEEVPFEITVPSERSAPPQPAGEVTKRYEKRPPPPVVVQIAETGKRVKISCGSTALDIGVARYEDLFYALPGQNASIFRLINDTILTRPEERDILKDMVNLLGGVDGGMTAIQNAVLKVEPPKRVPSKPPAVRPATVGPPSRPPAAKPVTSGPPSQARPGGPVPAKPGMPGKPPVPTGPRPITVTDDVELVDDVEVIPVAPVETGARPGVPGASARAPMGPGPKKSEPPSAKPPAKPGQPPSASPAKPLQPGTATPARPGAPMAGKPGGPPSKPGTPAPQPPSTLSPAQRRKKEIDRPAGKVEIKMTKEDAEKTGVKVKSIPNVGYQIICKEYYIQLSKAQYQELHYALPMPVMNMFKLIHNDLLKDPQSRGVLMKMIHLAGGPKDFMSALTLQVQIVKPTEDWQ